MRTKFSVITFNFSLGSFGTHRKGENTNIEGRNTKQIIMTEIQKSKTD